MVLIERLAFVVYYKFYANMNITNTQKKNLYKMSGFDLDTVDKLKTKKRPMVKH